MTEYLSKKSGKYFLSLVQFKMKTKSPYTIQYDNTVQICKRKFGCLPSFLKHWQVMGDFAVDQPAWWRWAYLGLWQSSSQLQMISPYTSQVVLGLFGQCNAQASKVTHSITQVNKYKIQLHWKWCCCHMLNFFFFFFNKTPPYTFTHACTHIHAHTFLTDVHIIVFMTNREEN